MKIQAVLFSILLSFPTLASTNSDGGHSTTCDMPVLEYTTGNREDDPEWFYSDSVEWVVESYHLYPNAYGQAGHTGWIVLIRMITDGDEDLEDHVMRNDGLTQIKVAGQWILQSDFEHSLCQ